jgi:hypothetical protein
MQPKCAWLFIFKILKNNADLESKPISCLCYIAEHVQEKLAVHDFIAQEWNIKTRSWFWELALSFDISLSFQNIEKIIVWSGWNCDFKVDSLPRAADVCAIFLDIVLERDVRNQAGIADFLNFWDKNAENGIPSQKEIMQCVWRFIKSKVRISGGDHSFCGRRLVENQRINYG